MSRLVSVKRASVAMLVAAAIIVRNANRTTFCDFASTFELIPIGLLPPVQVGVLQALSVGAVAARCGV